MFHSEQRQAHRPDEKAVHVKAFRGSKDGYLFFLPNGILWGFKKPLLFLPHERISAVSYTSVLQRTFNLAVEVDVSGADGEEKEEEFEFSMLDQEDFGGIDEFIKRYGLQDKSMAEQRKAKRLNVNVVKDEDGNVIGHAEAGELEKAAQEADLGAEDEEDEEEEDYDPGVYLSMLQLAVSCIYRQRRQLTYLQGVKVIAKAQDLVATMMMMTMKAVVVVRRVVRTKTMRMRMKNRRINCKCKEQMNELYNTLSVQFAPHDAQSLKWRNVVCEETKSETVLHIPKQTNNIGCFRAFTAHK